MDHYVGIDVSLEQTSVCVVDATGRIVRDVKVASEPEALVVFLARLPARPARVGLEAGPLSQWLHAGLAAAGHDAVLLETRHVKAALSAMLVKTDRKDARGIAQLLRMGWYRPVHRKAVPAQEMRALLVGRKLLQAKLLDVEGASRTSRRFRFSELFLVALFRNAGRCSATARVAGRRQRDGRSLRAATMT